MKKLLVLLCAATLVLGSCKKDATNAGEVSTVSTDYKAFIVEFTATWCPYCGDNGFPNWDPAFSIQANRVTGLSFHPGDGLVDADYPEQADFEAFYGCGGYPSAGYNATGNGYPSSTYFTNPVNTAIAANAQAKAGIGIVKSIEGNNMIVNTNTVLFADLTGKYALAVYISENGLVYNQSTTSTPIVGAVHNHVFRAAAGHKAFGETIIATSATKGTKFAGSYTIAIPSDVVNKDNLHVVVVLFAVDATGNPTAVINSNTL